MVKDSAADTRDVEEGQLAGQEAADGRLVGGVEHRPARPAAAGDFVP